MNTALPAEIFSEYVALSGAAREFCRDLDLSVFADADYANLLPTQWPRDDARFFGDGQFYHADGKARMLPIAAPAVVEAEGFVLNTGRNRDQWHTMMRTGKSAKLGAHLAEPYVEVHPDDAADMGVTSGDLMQLDGAHGSAILRALPSTRGRRGALFAPMHWTKQRSRAGRANALTVSEADPVSGQPALKSGRVSAARFEAAWYGFAAAAGPLTLVGDYAAIARTATGWQAECAGAQTPEDWDDFVHDLFGVQADLVQSFDARSNLRRFAFYDGADLCGLFFVSPTPVALSRNHAVSLIGTAAPALQALAGRIGAGQVDPGATLCACMNVGINTVRNAISDGAMTVDAVGAATCAGTNCGSCKPEIAALLAQAPQKMAAE